MGCCWSSDQISPEELEAQERAAREGALRKQQEEEDRRRLELEEQRRLETIRASYQQGLDVLKLEDQGQEGVANRDVLGLAPAMTLLQPNFQIVGTLSKDFQTRSGDQLLSYLGQHWNKFESYKYGGWQAGLSHLAFNHDNPEYVTNTTVSKTMTLHHLPPSSPWVKGVALCKLTDTTLALASADFSREEVDTLLEGVSGFIKKTMTAPSKTAKINFRQRVSEKRGTKYSDKGSIVPESYGESENALGQEEVVAFDWLRQEAPKDDGSLKRSGSALFAMCAQRWHLIRRDNPSFLLDAEEEERKDADECEVALLEGEVCLPTDAEAASFRFASSLRAGLYDSDEPSPFSTLYSAADCEQLYMRFSPDYTLELMPRSLDPPVCGLQPWRRARASELGRKEKKRYAYQRRYDYVRYIAPPSLTLAHDLHLKEIEATHALAPREDEMSVHIRLRYLVWRVFKHSHRIPSPTHKSSLRTGQSRRRFMLRRVKRVQHYHNSSKQHEEAMGHEIDPYFDPRAKCTGERSSMPGVTFTSRKQEEVRDMSRMLAHLQLFLKAQEHSERQLHLLVARQDREEQEKQNALKAEQEAMEITERKKDGLGDEADAASMNSDLKSRGSRNSRLTHSSSRTKAKLSRRSTKHAGPSLSPSRKRAIGASEGGSGNSTASISTGVAEEAMSLASHGDGDDPTAGTKDGAYSSSPSEGQGGSSIRVGCDQVAPKRTRTPKPLPALMPYTEWLQSLGPASVGTSQFNTVSTWDTMLNLLDSLRERIVDGGGTYSTKRIEARVNTTTTVAPSASGPLQGDNLFLTRLLQGALLHEKNARSVALGHDSAVTAALLYPTDGKVHKFSKKQQAKGHSSAQSNHGKLPADLYITPREIEEDTVGSSFVEADESIASKTVDSDNLHDDVEKGVDEKKSGVGDEDAEDGGLEAIPEGNDMGSPDASLGPNNPQLAPLTSLNSLRDRPGMYPAAPIRADMTAQTMQRYRRLFQRKASHVLTRNSRDKPDVFVMTTPALGPTASNTAKKNSEESALMKMTAQHQALREEDEERGGVKHRYVAARKRFASFLEAQDRNELLLKRLERLGEASAALCVLRSDKEKALASLVEAQAALEAMQAGVAAASHAEPTPLSELNPPPMGGRVVSDTVKRRDLSAGMTVVEASVDPMEASLKLVMEREDGLEELQRQEGWLVELTEQDTSAVTDLHEKCPGDMEGIGRRRPMDLPRYIQSTAQTLLRQHHYAEYLCATQVTTSVLAQQWQVRAAKHSIVTRSLLGELRSAVEETCLLLAEKLRDRHQRKIVGEAIDSHSLLPSRATTAFSGPPASRERVQVKSSGKRAPSLLHALSKAGLAREKPTELLVSTTGSDGNSAGTGTNGSGEAGSEDGFLLVAKKTYRRRDVASILFPTHTDPTLPPPPPSTLPRPVQAIAPAGEPGPGSTLLPGATVFKKKSSHRLRFEAEGRARWQEAAPCYLNAFDASSGARKTASFYGKSKRMAVFRAYLEAHAIVQSLLGEIVDFATAGAAAASASGTAMVATAPDTTAYKRWRKRCAPRWKAELGFSLPIPPPSCLTWPAGNEDIPAAPPPLLPLQQLVLATFCDETESVCRGSRCLALVGGGLNGEEGYQYRLTLTFSKTLESCSYRKVVDASVSAFRKGESDKMTVRLNARLGRKLLFALQEQHCLRKQYTTIMQRLSPIEQAGKSGSTTSPPKSTNRRPAPEDACHFTLSLQ